MFRKILIANRGEIAVRIARTLREMDIASVAVYSDADADAPHVGAADEAFPIGPALPAQSYLNQDRILEVARESGAEAIHPGYGFLSENAGFAQRCADEGVAFVGPSAAAIAAMGNKIEARRAAKAAGVPIVPGTEAPLDDPAAIAAVAADLDYPVLIKAAAGGGGYGMRVVARPEGVQAALDGVRRDAQRAFGNATVYVEKFFSPAPRHVEVQVFGDLSGRVVSLGERECSLQRRFQKIVEETPSPAVSPELRARMGEAAVALARAIGYTNAGTIECLVDNRGDFYFLEMNTRLQVEHPVTEMVTGLDLVREQVRVAAGEPLSVPNDGFVPGGQPGGQLGEQPRDQPGGHAIEARIYAEDPAKAFMPSPGSITRLVEPVGDGVRVDSGMAEGSKVAVYYDPLIAKLVCWGEDRPDALTRMRAALAAYEIEGVKTNLPFLRLLFAHPDVVAGRTHTRFVDERLAEIMAGA